MTQEIKIGDSRKCIFGDENFQSPIFVTETYLDFNRQQQWLPGPIQVFGPDFGSGFRVRISDPDFWSGFLVQIPIWISGPDFWSWLLV